MKDVYRLTKHVTFVTGRDLEMKMQGATRLRVDGQPKAKTTKAIALAKTSQIVSQEEKNCGWKVGTEPFPSRTSSEIVSPKEAMKWQNVAPSYDQKTYNIRQVPAAEDVAERVFKLDPLLRLLNFVIAKRSVTIALTRLSSMTSSLVPDNRFYIVM